MRKIVHFSHNEIIERMENRVAKTNILFNYLNGINPISENVDLEIQVYFKYYFDVFTTIERVVRSIASTRSSNSQYFLMLSKAEDGEKPYLIPKDELKSLLEICAIPRGEVHSTTFRSKLVKKFDIFQGKKVKYSIKNSDDFFEKYKQLRIERNLLAHGIEAPNNIEFSLSKLNNYLCVLYALLSIYENIEISSIDETQILQF